MLADYQNSVLRLVRPDADDIDSLDIDDALVMATTRYSKDRPRTVVEDVIAAGGQVLDLPAEWVSGFSQIRQMEYPVGNVPPNLIEAWEIYQAPTGESILIPDSLQNAETVRLTFSVFHTLDDSSDTIPMVDKEAVASYAAALLCDQLASEYAGDTNSTIQADSVDHGDKARKFATRAAKLRKRYQDAVGVQDKTNMAAGVVVDLDGRDSRGNDRLMHPGRYR